MTSRSDVFLCSCFHSPHRIILCDTFLGIPVLHRAIKLLRREPGQLLSIHSDLYQLSLLCQWFEPALTYLDTDIIDIHRESGKFDVKHLLLAYYYGGMIYACLKRYDRAANFFENVITVPASATSAIALEAYKKYVLVKLISGAVVNQSLPSYTSRHVQQAVKSLCGAQYTELFNLFNNGTLTQFDEFVTRHRDTFTHDRNLGLIKQTRHAFICNSIQQLTKTFLTVSLKDLAHRVQLLAADEAEKYLLDMIANGQIFASINKKDGTNLRWFACTTDGCVFSRHGHISWFARKIRCQRHARQTAGRNGEAHASGKTAERTRTTDLLEQTLHSTYTAVESIPRSVEDP